jgi:hypothetical protein
MTDPYQDPDNNHRTAATIVVAATAVILLGGILIFSGLGEERPDAPRAEQITTP